MLLDELNDYLKKYDKKKEKKGGYKIRKTSYERIQREVRTKKINIVDNTIKNFIHHQRVYRMVEHATGLTKKQMRELDSSHRRKLLEVFKKSLAANKIPKGEYKLFFKDGVFPSRERIRCVTEKGDVEKLEFIEHEEEMRVYQTFKEIVIMLFEDILYDTDKNVPEIVSYLIKGINEENTDYSWDSTFIQRFFWETQIGNLGFTEKTKKSVKKVIKSESPLSKKLLAGNESRLYHFGPFFYLFSEEEVSEIKCRIENRIRNEYDEWKSNRTKDAISKIKIMKEELEELENRIEENMKG